MKTRLGFVSNSSSSSFVISKKFLSPYQIERIKNHLKESKELSPADWEEDWWNEDHDQWDIIEKDYLVRGDTCMDNFDMATFLSRIGVPMHEVDWGE